MPEPSALQMINGFVTGAASVPATIVAARMPVSTMADIAEFYFDLQIVEEIPADPFDDPQKIEFQPGQQIHLRVTTSDNGSADQRAFKIRGNLRLGLLCVGAPAAGIAITGSRLQVALKELDTLAHDFEITLSDQCPRGEVTFELLFNEDGKPQKFTAAKLTRTIAGNENPIYQTLLDSVKINLNTDTPEQVAILHILGPSAGKYNLKGYNLRVDTLAIELRQPDDEIGLADFVEGEVSPDDVWGTVNGISRHTLELRNWFQQLHKEHKEQLCLIIADHTGAEFPWEMFEFDEDKHLGTMCLVTRWISVQKNLVPAPQQYRGGVIAHLDYEELEHTDSELKVLTQLKADLHNDAETLRQRLTQPLQNVGLVYLACHGIFAYNQKHKAAVGSLKNPSQRISIMQLENLKSLADAQPLFFVNACHSARLMRDRQSFSNDLSGLPEVILRRLSSGYIGTLGPVGMKYAAHIGQEILERARSLPDGVNLAEELRRIRAEAVKQVKHDPSEENLRNLIFAFMYVYYGNPLARLRLTGADADNEEADK